VGRGGWTVFAVVAAGGDSRPPVVVKTLGVQSPWWAAAVTVALRPWSRNSQNHPPLPALDPQLRFPPFPRHGVRQTGGAHNTLDHELSNARSESTNTHLRVLTRRAYGFRSPQALITMAMFTRSGLCSPLPARSSKD
jgi:hypothetical protein